MNVQTKEIYSEVYSILNLLGEEYIKKLPENLFNMIKEEKLDSYSPNYTLSLDSLNKNVKKDTLAMISLFHLKYWCDSEDEKQKLRKLFKSNDDKHQEELRKNYNPDNIFKKSIKETDVHNDNVSKANIQIYKEPLFKALINKIKAIFTKK